MTRLVMCSWCHRMVRLVPGTSTWCQGCGHRADVPRISCDCPACSALTAAVRKNADGRPWWEVEDDGSHV